MKKDALIITLVFGLFGAAMVVLFVIGIVMIINGEHSTSSNLTVESTTVTIATDAKTTKTKMSTTTVAGMKPNRKGKTIDDPVPFDTYEESGDNYCDAQLKITGIIRGEKAAKKLNRISDEGMEYVIVQYSMKITRLDQGPFSPPSLTIVLEDGTLNYHFMGSSSEQLKSWESLNFVATGSVESDLVFLVPKGQTRALYLRNTFLGRAAIYFAIV